MLVHVIRVQSLNLCRVHALKFQSFRLRIVLDELFHVGETTTDATHQFIVHNFGVDFLGAEHVPAIADTRDRNLAVLDVKDVGKHLINAVTLHSAVLTRSDNRNFHCLLDFRPDHLKLVLELLALLIELAELDLTRLDCLCDLRHAHIVAIELLEFELIVLAVQGNSLALYVHLS